MGITIFDGFGGIVRIFLLACMAYVAVVAILRVSGKRTLAKLNAFDLIVTVALGSTLASSILSSNTPLLETLTAFATLVALQWVVAWASVRSSPVAALVRSEPKLLMRGNEILHGALKSERVTEAELMTVIRQSSARSPEQVEAVIFETDGTFSVIPRSEGETGFPEIGLDIASR